MSILFEERLKSLRAEHQISQKMLAEKLFVSQQAVAKWENPASKATPNPETLAKIAALFDVSTDYLLGATDIKKSPTEQAVSEKARELDAVMDHLSEEDRRRVLEFAQNLAMTMQKQEPSK